MNEIIAQLNASLQQFFNQFAIFIPKLLGALAILIIGWIVAIIIKAVATKLFKVLKVDTIAEKAGINDMLKKGDVKMNLSSFLGKLVYWMIMLIVILVSLNSLDLTSVQGLFNQIILYLPNVFAAVFILLFGLYIAKFASESVGGVLKNMEADSIALIQKVTYVAIIVFTAFLALHQLGIAQNIIELAFGLLFGSLCLAIGIAFGLGGKDFAAELINKLKK